MPLQIPEAVVALKGHLHWEASTLRTSRTTLDPLNDLLFLFTRLATAADGEIETFAARYGILGLCKHGLPQAHLRQEISLDLNRGIKVCPPLSTERGWGAGESLERWRHYAAQTKAVMVACDLTRHGKRPTPEVWSVLSEYFPDFALPAEEYGPSGRWPERSRVAQGSKGDGGPIEVGGIATSRIWNRPQAALSHLLRRWLDLAAVRPSFMWTSDARHDPLTGERLSQKADLTATSESTGLRNDVGISVAASSLFGTLVLQVVAAVAGTYRLRLCRHCMNVFGAARSDQTYCHAPECDQVRKAGNRKKSPPRT